jgi:hypothetical protein
MRLVGAGALVAFGLYKLLKPLSHPRWVGLRVSGRDLVVWSFLMATAHGAGLMLVPVLLNLPPDALGAAATGSGDHALMMSTPGMLSVSEVLAVGVHTGAMYLVMAGVAILVFDHIGLSILRRGWVNLDRLWAASLVGVGVVTFVI